MSLPRDLVEKLIAYPQDWKYEPSREMKNKFFCCNSPMIYYHPESGICCQITEESGGLLFELDDDGLFIGKDMSDEFAKFRSDMISKKMPQELLNRHNAICEEVLVRRANNTITEDEDDNLSEEAADIWYKLSRVERREAQIFLNDFRKAHPEVD